MSEYLHPDKLPLVESFASDVVRSALRMPTDTDVMSGNVRDFWTRVWRHKGSSELMLAVIAGRNAFFGKASAEQMNAAAYTLVETITADRGEAGHEHHAGLLLGFAGELGDPRRNRRWNDLTPENQTRLIMIAVNA